MKTSLKHIILVVWLLLLLVSCSKQPQFIKIDNVNIEGLKDSLMHVSMDYVIYNPNNVKTKLKQSGMAIYYHDTLVGTGTLNKEINLPSNDTIKVPVACEIRLDKLSKFYPEMLQSDATAFSIRGENKIGFLMNSFTIDVEETIYLDTKSIIRKEINKNLNTEGNFKLKKVVVNALPTLDKTRFKLEIEAQNNLPFDYEIHEMKLQFFLDDAAKEPVAQWKQEAPILQQKYQPTTIPIEVVVANLNLLKNTKLTMLFKQEIDFIVIGNLQVKIQEYTFNVPVNDQMKLNLKTFLGL
tara:strand:- start:430292 stop:431179 length:888 start_codon:yes stop_codon:yes gene_type:complete